MNRQVICIAALIAIVGCSENHHHHGPLQLEDLPAAARDAVNQTIPNGKVTLIEVSHKHGITKYSVHLIANGDYWEVIVDDNGTVLKKRHEKHLHNEETG